MLQIFLILFLLLLSGLIYCSKKTKPVQIPEKIESKKEKEVPINIYRNEKTNPIPSKTYKTLIDWLKKNFSDFSNCAKGKSAGYIKSTVETSNSATFYAFDSNPTLNRYISPKCRDSSRVILENHKTDYINANWVVCVSKEYRGKNILTQAPLKNTIPDFWAMIYQEKVEYIVMFCGFMEQCARYLPIKEGGVEKYENFEVKFVRKEKDPVEGVSWKILHLYDRKSIDTRPRRVNHIHVTSWAENTTPDDPKLIVELYRWLMKKNESHIPMVFHCNNGIGRSAIFAAIYFLIRLDFDEDDLLISGMRMN
ncbi:unnamed protein product [Caenorhabditis angaria]|uniref:Tyrosine-protein phosphatase domain-containing protein n=1 Tax=Caenorhabditis angaria TaxID=860376 RepID=A0A9P1J3R4_9PELO|nr:unnamed protein product [Caenorhabditis angaria]